MLADAAFCDSLRLIWAARDDSVLVVARLVGLQQIRERVPIPTANLAVTRFEAGVLASSSDWISAGWISKHAFGLVFPFMPSRIDEAVAASTSRYSFQDPWGGFGSVSLACVVASVQMSGSISFRGLLEEAARRVNSQLAEAGRDDYSDPLEGWCPQVST